MRRMLVVAVTVLAVAGCSSDKPGSQAVYDRISGETGCVQLQQEFDTASASHDRATAGSSAAEAATGYMEAANDRMKSLGC